MMTGSAVIFKGETHLPRKYTADTFWHQTQAHKTRTDIKEFLKSGTMKWMVEPRLRYSVCSVLKMYGLHMPAVWY
jgi:hypothetical protein